ncbi:MAG: hypothetical protein AB1306_04880 [Nitrospirota bacterium]
MDINKKFQESVTPFIPLIASSLINATYSRISVNNTQFNEAVFKREYSIILKQWVDATMKLYESLVD